MEISSTFFLLVGIPRYRHLGMLPAAGHNIHGLQQVLHKKNQVDFKMISDSNQKVEDVNSFYKELEDIVKNKDYKTLVLYYAGHGTPTENDGVVLSTYETNPESINFRESIFLNQVNQILMTSPQLRVIIILDCCFSERAINYIKQPNRCILAAASSDSTTLYPKASDYSIFTAKLIEILENGRVDFGDFLSLENIYQILTNESTTSNIRFSKAGDIADVSLFKNLRTPKETSEENENHLRNIFSAVSKYQAPSPASKSSLRKMLEFMLRKYPYMISYLLKNLFDDQTPVSIDYLINYYDVLKKFFYYVLVAKIISKKTQSISNQNSRGSVELAFNNSYVEKIDELIHCAKKIDEDNEGGKKSFTEEIISWESGLRDLITTIDKAKEERDRSVIKSLLMDATAKIAFTTSYTFLSVNLIEVQYHNKYMKNPQYEHIACHLAGETLKGYDMSVILDQVELSLVWERFYFNKAVIMSESFDPETKEIKGVVNMWPFMIDQTVYSPMDSAIARRQLPVLMLLHEKDGENYMYQGLNTPRQPNRSYFDLTKAYIANQRIRDQFNAFEDDLEQLA